MKVVMLEELYLTFLHIYVAVSLSLGLIIKKNQKAVFVENSTEGR